MNYRARKRILPWLPPPAPRYPAPFQFNLFAYQEEYERRVDRYLNDDKPYVYEEAEQFFRTLPYLVADRLEGRYVEKNWRRLRKQVYKRDGGMCMVCGSLLTGENYQFYECGHIIDRCVRGPDHINNLVVMCISCNRLKPVHETREEYLAWAEDPYWGGLLTG